MFRHAGIILCGGTSRRMGRPKVMLPFGPETMLQRVVRLLSRAVDVTVVVAAPDQELPDLPSSIILAHDRHPDRGPLEGLAVGLQTLGDRAEAAFVSACDVPLLKPALVRRKIELSAGHQIAVPHVGGFDHPLDVDPELQSLANVNGPEDYSTILKRAGFPHEAPGPIGRGRQIESSGEG